MPPASPMHVFVRQYMRLQFDRERDENYEKRTMVGGTVRRINLAIERHASKIHTRNMFGEFGRLLIVIEGTAYNVTEVERMRKYITTHNNAAKREKWSRVEYEVIINEDKSIFSCECGQFEHTGMLCSHVLRMPERGDALKKPRKPGKCKNCGIEGHRRNTCKRPLGFAKS